MAKLDALPSIDIIHGFRGVLDFYLWKGLPCVRSWPRTPRSHLTAGTLAAAALFGAIVKAYSLLGANPKADFAADAADQTRTGRDIYVTAVFGNLHEASMSDFLTLLTECRDFLSNLTDLLHALDSVDTDELVVNVDESVLPAGAATAAHQVTANTALAIIDNLANALGSVNTDDLQVDVKTSALPAGAATQSTLATISANLAVLNNLRWALASIANDRFLVRGMDQLFSLKGTLARFRQAAVSGAGGYLDSPAVPAGEYWIVTNIMARDVTSATTGHRYEHRHDGSDFPFWTDIKAIKAADYTFWGGQIVLDPEDVIRARFFGSQAGDTCIVFLTGYVMTLEP